MDASRTTVHKVPKRLLRCLKALLMQTTAETGWTLQTYNLMVCTQNGATPNHPYLQRIQSISLSVYQSIVFLNLHEISSFSLYILNHGMKWQHLFDLKTISWGQALCAEEVACSEELKQKQQLQREHQRLCESVPRAPWEVWRDTRKGLCHDGYGEWYHPSRSHSIRFSCTDIFLNEAIIWHFVGCWSRRSLILCLCGQSSTSPCFLHSQVQEASNRTVNVQAQKFCDGFVLWDLVTTSWSVCFWLSHTFTGWWGIVVIWCHSQDLKECHNLISLAALHMLINKDHAVIWIASLLNTFEPGARVATSIGPKKKFLLPQKSFGVWTILINLYKLQQLDRCLWWSAKTSEPSCCPMFHVQSSSMSCRSKARGAKPLGVIKKDFSGKSQKVFFWKTSHS